MERIKQFLDTVFAKEQEVIFLEYQKDKIEACNKLIEELNVFCRPYFDTDYDMEIPFNIRGKIVNPASDRFYKAKENAPYPRARYLYKISSYPHEKYGEVWACYVSETNPSEITKSISDCYIVAEISKELKFISKMGIVSGTNKWTFYGGDEDKSLRLNNLQKPSKTERFTEPVNDEWSLKEYLKDK